MHALKSCFHKSIRQSPIWFILTIAVFIVCTLLLWPAYVRIVEWQFFHTHYVSLQERASYKSCEIPMPDPFDKTVMEYIHKREAYECKFVQPELTYLGYDGVLRLNNTALEQYNLTSEYLDCRYRTFKKKENDDDHVFYDKEKILNVSEKIVDGREFVAVTCKYKGKINYYNFHSFVPRKRFGGKMNVKGQPFKPQVFILVLESMSRINMIRHMPRTYSYLTNVMNMEVLKGFTKVADNSFPNMIAFLTGHKVKMTPPELPGNESTGPFDSWPFVWKSFAKEGYVTGYTEDCPEYATLNYLAKGCLKQPTDYYTRPLWLAMEESPLCKRSSSFCFANTPTYTIIFDWIREFIVKHSKELYFLFSFYIAVTHTNFNNAQYLDGDVLKLLKDLNEEGHFKDAVVMMLGDHGNRYGDILTTLVGQIEERMPLFAISIPSTLEQQYPHLRSYLRKNSKRLTTFLDVHSMMMDIASSTYHQTKAQHVWNTRGFSPWRMPIPSNRTCEQAGVPENYCVCQKEVEIPPNDPRCQDASTKLVDHLNDMLKSMEPLCAKLVLNKTLQASVILPSQHIALRKGYALKIRILISLMPSEAVVEGLLQKTAWSSEYEVMGDVSRLNKYGNQSACIQHREMRKFCYCVVN